MTNELQERITRYDQALRRFADWFNRLRKPDGSLDAPNLGISAYMPVPVYAHATGDLRLLANTLDYLDKLLAKDTSFLSPPGKPLLPYRGAWLLMGTVLREYRRLAEKLEKWMLGFQHAATGGFFGTEASRRVGEGEICFDSTTNVCAALCASGNLTDARRTGRFLLQLCRAQPEPKRRFYTVWHTSKGLVTAFDPAQARSYVIEWEQPHQYLYKIGLLARGLALLHLHANEAECLSVAESVHRTAAEKTPAVWTNTLAHKLGWSAHLLHLVTKKPEYIEHACRIADRVASLQQPDGAFHYPEFWPPYEQVSIEQKFNIGCQFATWIANARALSNGEC